MTYEEFETKLNQAFEQIQNNLSSSSINDSEYILTKTDSINYFLNLLERKNKNLI